MPALVVAAHCEEVIRVGLTSLLGSIFFDSDHSGISSALPVSLLEGLHTKQAVKPLFLATARSEAQPVLA